MEDLRPVERMSWTAIERAPQCLFSCQVFADNAHDKVAACYWSERVSLGTCAAHLCLYATPPSSPTVCHPTFISNCMLPHLHLQLYATPPSSLPVCYPTFISACMLPHLHTHSARRAHTPGIRLQLWEHIHLSASGPCQQSWTRQSRWSTASGPPASWIV